MIGRYDELFNLPTHLICVLSRNGEFIQTNIAQKNLLGWEPSELIGKPVSEFIHTDDISRTLSEVGRLVQAGGVLTDFRNRCTHRDGTFRWFSWSASFKDNQVYAIGTDVTAQVEAEEKAKLNESQLIAFFEMLPQIAWIHHGSKEIKSSYNKVWYEYTGLDPRVQSREQYQQAVHPDDREEAIDKFYSAVQFGSKYEMKLRLRRHDGVYRWFLARSVPLKDEHGKIISWLGTSTDIDDQVSASEKLHSLFMQAPACITVHSGPEHRYEFSNELNNRVLGRNDLVGKTIAQAFSGKGAEELLPIYDRVYQTGEPFAFNELPVKFDWLGNGQLSERFMSCLVQATRSSVGEINGLMTFAVDMTAQVEARKEIESAKTKAEAANTAKTEFLANMSHEIRTPLTAVIGFSELAQEVEHLPFAAQQYLDRIRANAQHLVHLIGDILDLSKIESSGLDVILAQTSLSDLVSDVFAMVEASAKKKSLKLSMQFDPSVPSAVCTDATLLRQILSNLLSNAIKFTSSGSIELKARLHEEKLEIEVSDTGIGIDPEKATHLFHPFTQADSSMSREYGGTGLGLALSRRIARALGGDITIKSSKLGKGTTFLVVIPDRAAELLQTKQNPDSILSEDLPNLHVLLVEDSRDNQFLMTRYLESAGVKVDIANNGEEALHHCSKQKYSVILMDIQMPVMDGYTATAHLRARGYTGRIVALTAHAMKDERTKAFAGGFDDYLTKPIQKEILLNALRRQSRGAGQVETVHETAAKL